MSDTGAQVGIYSVPTRNTHTHTHERFGSLAEYTRTVLLHVLADVHAVVDAIDLLNELLVELVEENVDQLLLLALVDRFLLQ